MNMEFSLAICLVGRMEYEYGVQPWVGRMKYEYGVQPWVGRMKYEYGVQPCDLMGWKDEV